MRNAEKRSRTSKRPWRCAVSSRFEKRAIARRDWQDLVFRFDSFVICFFYTGNGRYQYTFLLVCGIIFICVGCQYGANAYILPSAECDLDMRSEEKGFLNVAFLIGNEINQTLKQS